MSNNRRAIAECKSFIESVGKLKTDAMIWKETEKATHSGLVISSLPFVAPSWPEILAPPIGSDIDLPLKVFKLAGSQYSSVL